MWRAYSPPTNEVVNTSKEGVVGGSPVEPARGIEPSNRRRVGPEARLVGFCGGGQPLARSPRRGRIPFETSRLEVHMWSWREELNLQPAVYKTAALPLSYASLA